MTDWKQRSRLTLTILWNFRTRKTTKLHAGFFKVYCLAAFSCLRNKNKKSVPRGSLSHMDAVEEFARKKRKSLPIFKFEIGMLKTYIKNLLETSLSTPEKASCKWWQRRNSETTRMLSLKQVMVVGIYRAIALPVSSSQSGSVSLWVASPTSCFITAGYQEKVPWKPTPNYQDRLECY